MKKLLLLFLCLSFLLAANTGSAFLGFFSHGQYSSSSCATFQDGEIVSNNEYTYLGKFDGYQYMAYEFQAGSDYTICGLKLKLRKYNSGQNLTIRIYSTNTTPTPNEPDSDLTGGGEVITAATLTTSLTEYTINFSTTPALTNGTTYFIVLNTPTYSATDYLGVQRDGNGAIENGKRSGDGLTWAGEDTQNSITFWTYSE